MQQQRSMQFMSLQKPPQPSAQKTQQRQGPSGQLSGPQSQASAVSMNMKTDQILNQLQTLACNTQAQTENTEKLQQRLHKSEEMLETQKRQNQVLRMENGKIVEQLRLSKCSMEQLEVQVQTLVSNVEEQRNSTRAIQEKLVFAETRYDESKEWRENLDKRLAKAKDEIRNIHAENAKVVGELNSEIEVKNGEIEDRNNKIEEARQDCERLRLELDQANRHADDRNSEILALQTNNKHLMVQVEALTKELECAKVDATEKKLQLELVEMERTKLDSDVQITKNQMKEQAASFEKALSDTTTKSKEQLHALQGAHADQIKKHSEDIEALTAKVRKSEQYAQTLVLELEDQGRRMILQAESMANAKATEEEHLKHIQSIRSEYAEAALKIESLGKDLFTMTEEKIATSNAIYEMESILEKRVQDLESTLVEVVRHSHMQASDGKEVRANLDKMTEKHQADQLQYQQKLEEASKQMEESLDKIGALEKQVREAEHKADERIKHNLFEVQRHLNTQLVANKEEHAKAMSAHVAQIATLQEQVKSLEAVVAQSQCSVNKLRDVEEQNDKLRTELFHESSKVEQLTKDFDEQTEKLANIKKRYHDLEESLKQNSVNATIPSSSLQADQADIRKALFKSPQVANELGPTRALSSRAEISSYSSSQTRLAIDCSQDIGSQQQHLEFESDSGGSMKKRALGTSSKSKTASKRASKKQGTPVFEAVTLKKSAPVTHGKEKDSRQWDDNCAEFDLFGQ